MEALKEKAKRYYAIHHDPQYTDEHLLSAFASEIAKEEAWKAWLYISNRFWDDIRSREKTERELFEAYWNERSEK